MKKIISICCLLLLVVIVVCGCENSSTDSKTEDMENDILKVGIDLKFYPFMYEDDNGQPKGLEVDIANAFGEFIGKKVEIINTDFSMLMPALETGNIDIIISDMSENEERKQKVDFSYPYRYGRILALVNKEFAEKNNITDNMSENDFFLIPNTRYTGLSGTISITIPQQYGKDVVEVTEISTALLDITKGKADVLIGGNTVRGDHAAHRDTTIIYDGFHEYGQSCFEVKKGNKELLEKANSFIKSMYEKDGFYEKAGTKYDKEIGEFLHDDTLGLDYIIYPPKQ